jgi:hypothetical protein
MITKKQMLANNSLRAFFKYRISLGWRGDYSKWRIQWRIRVTTHAAFDIDWVPASSTVYRSGIKLPDETLMYRCKKVQSARLAIWRFADKVCREDPVFLLNVGENLLLSETPELLLMFFSGVPPATFVRRDCYCISLFIS